MFYGGNVQEHYHMEVHKGSLGEYDLTQSFNITQSNIFALPDIHITKFFSNATRRNTNNSKRSKSYRRII